MSANQRVFRLCGSLCIQRPPRYIRELSFRSCLSAEYNLCQIFCNPLLNWRSGRRQTMPEATPIKKYAAEALGTFCLVFAGTGAIVINDVSGGTVTHVGVALTFGLVVMAMIYAVGDISGAHINPAVTCGFWIARRFPGAFVVPYIISQLAGAFAASILIWALFTHPTLGATHPAGGELQSFVLELVLTAMLMFVILGVAVGPKEKGLLAGVAVGGAIAFEALFAGPICGASMNPARSIAPAIVSGQIGDLWIYVVAPFLGAAIGVLCNRITT
jgi:MIP family channel proteins